MIYTIGLTKSYERYFREQGSPMKAVGGSVWKTREEASQHADALGGYSVYGVDADWESHTTLNDTPSHRSPPAWRDLTIDAKLIRLSDG